MTQPKIIVHMTQSINGNITGPYHEAAGNGLSKAYESTNQQFESNALILGRKTIEEAFANNEMPTLPAHPEKYSRKEDFVADTELTHFVISIDPSGKAAWTQNYIQYNDRPEMHVIEVISEQVSDAYLEHLRNLGISYVFGGENSELDLKLVVSKLNSLFNLETMTLSGGGGINWSFFQQDLVDEVSVVIAPVVDDHYNRPNMFDNNNPNRSHVPEAFTIKQLEQLEDDVIWIHYTR
ncbi:dihydrofolate reductase family protein [Staphylococcus argenteus]|uniref:dihydrofolate reductase family protein n=1 Tax=Staphylococcus argenteus TaxID=985002 RepID=UPI00050201D4|nr:dihydrofolate reductase family protein [Staphylococcus argenteus]MBE2133108.1 dihydrofolate reductase family protein [Staphylococcus argenteus]MBE2136757.1 dihydrofolate reductase family protein [Staphylococcus argenteus]MBE2147726.1 dihydrofolate reductase family protein [Staphylococcus argenteus]MBE2161752.1 dihydrofolate reductase family protein [Staphylococcus argenteus]MCG9795238.1 dihydrofolate reductase family protein [Staphylococcus argenteus]